MKSSTRSIFSPVDVADGINLLESSIANVSFEGVEEDTKCALVETTLEAIASLESMTMKGDREHTPPPHTASLGTAPSFPPAPIPPPGSRNAVPQLPTELVCHILSFIPLGSQETFAHTSKVSRCWYSLSTSFLYARPRLTSKNFQKFVSVICPSVSSVKHSPFAGLVKSLDLSKLGNDGTGSVIARLLRRTQSSLEEFIAPQHKFGLDCLLALSKCHKLRVLDLRLTEGSVGVVEFFKYIKGLPNVRALSFPRSMLSVSSKHTQFILPRKLERFCLSGGMTDTFLMTVDVPETLNELHISHLSFARYASLRNLLNRLSPQLTILTVNYHIPTLPHNALDKILVMCPHLKRLCVAVDFITLHMFDEENTPPDHPLRYLDLDSSGAMGTAQKLKPNDVYITLAEGRLPHVRVVRISQKLQWCQLYKGDVQDLVDLLEYRRDQNLKEAGQLAGIWEYEDTGYIAIV